MAGIINKIHLKEHDSTPQPTAWFLGAYPAGRSVRASSDKRFDLEGWDALVSGMKVIADLASVMCEMDPDLRSPRAPSCATPRTLRLDSAFHSVPSFSLQATITAHLFHIRPPETPFDLCRLGSAS
ncbi:hypothetical protein NEUTE2DRAFT_125365 [Neurospora tetrasperma FGSC 2509]|nr:hypothetical protein NEUTE2DRAFT_125365 [Neurospora tetrasperma FGSC 2509]